MTGKEDMTSYTAKYTKIDSGYMGQLVEWPEVVTEGRDLEECRLYKRHQGCSGQTADKTLSALSTTVPELP